MPMGGKVKLSGQKFIFAKQKRLCRSGIVRPTSPGCGSQRLFRPLGGPHILLAAAPTAPPCFRRWLSSCVCCFFEPSLQGLEKAEHCPSFASLHLPLAAVSSATVVAVALAELGSIAGAAPPPTRCSPVRWETSVKQKRLCRSRAVKAVIR